MVYVVSHLGTCCYVVAWHVVNVVTFILCASPATAQIFKISSDAAIGKTFDGLS